MPFWRFLRTENVQRNGAFMMIIKYLRAILFDRANNSWDSQEYAYVRAISTIEIILKHGSVNVILDLSFFSSSGLVLILCSNGDSRFETLFNLFANDLFR